MVFASFAEDHVSRPKVGVTHVCGGVFKEDANGRLPFGFTAKEDGLSDGDDDASTDALVEEMLQQGDTAVIYPEAPEDEPQRLGTPDASVRDENGAYSPNATFRPPEQTSWGAQVQF